MRATVPVLVVVAVLLMVGVGGAEKWIERRNAARVSARAMDEIEEIRHSNYRKLFERMQNESQAITGQERG